MFFLVRDGNLRSFWTTLQVSGYESDDKLIGNQANGGSNGDGQGAKNNRVQPLSTIQMHNVESFASNENYHDLAPNHNTINGDEEPISRHAFKDIKLIVETAIAKSLLA